MIRKKVLIVILIFICAATGISAQESGSVWEGTASMSKMGEFPATGYYAGSNSFPRNTIVEVENTETGKRVSVIVSDRLDNPGLFMLLSKEAAEDLGMSASGTAIVRVRRERSLDGLGLELFSERPYTNDPDLNPAAAIAEYTEMENEAETGVTEEPEVVIQPDTTPESDGEGTVTPETPRLAASSAETPAVRPLGSVAIAEPVEPVRAEPEIVTEPETAADTPRLSGVSGSPSVAPLGAVSLAEPPEPVAVRTVTEEEPEIIVEQPETPRLSGVAGTPGIAPLGRVELAEPEAPAAAVVEDTSEEPEVETPRLTQVADTPRLRSIGAVVLAEPESPEEPVEAVEIVETPRISEVGGAPSGRGLGALVLAEPGTPERQSGAEETESVLDETPRLSLVTRSPEMGVLGGFDLAEPAAVPEKAEDAAETPALASVSGSPEEETLRLAEVNLPEEPAEKSEIVNETVEDTPGVFALSGSPGVEELRTASIDEPVEPSEEPVITEERPGVIAMNESPAVEEYQSGMVDMPADPGNTPRLAEERPVISDVEESPSDRPSSDVTDLAMLDEPEVIERESGETEDTGLAVIDDTTPVLDLEEGETLVMEPAEPRPPEDVVPESVVVPGSSQPEPESIEDLENSPHSPDTPEEKKKEPLIADNGGKVDRIEEKEPVAEESGIEAGSVLEKGAFYVQLAVYSEEDNAQQLVDKFGVSYPVAVLHETTATKNMYKVLLGPVNQDESGGLLYNFRMRGFKDAFIRKGQ